MRSICYFLSAAILALATHSIGGPEKPEGSGPNPPPGKKVVCENGVCRLEDATPADHSVYKIGDPAPPLKITQWLRGESVEKFHAGRTYIVEFWATWCGPCVASIPHLTELQKKYKDQGLTIIGVADAEMGKTEEEKLAILQSFLSDKGKGMEYTAAYAPAQSMSKTWMGGFQVGGIPHAFIVDKNGRIAFVGHPMAMDEPLEKILNGTWDLDAFSKTWSKENREMSAKMTKLREFDRATKAAKEEGNWTRAIALVDTALSEESLFFALSPLALKLEKTIFLLHLGRTEESAALTKQLLTESQGNPISYLTFLRAYAKDPEKIQSGLMEKIPRRETLKELATGMEAIDAMAHDDLKSHKDLLWRWYLANAVVFSEAGDLAKAQELSQKALSLAPEQDKKDVLEFMERLSSCANELKTKS